MDAHWEIRQRSQERLDSEKNRMFAPGPHALALVVPSPYPLGMAGLGALWVYARVNSTPNWCCERLFAPDPPMLHQPWRSWPHAAICTMETRTPLSEFGLIGVSLSAETEVPVLLGILQRAGIEPLRSRRNGPMVIIGGPLALVAPKVVGAIADVVFLGDSERSLPAFLAWAAAGTGESDPLEIPALDGVWIPACSGDPVPPAVCDLSIVDPAVSLLVTPEAQFGEKVLVEVSRGCSRRCAFCMISRPARGTGMRVFAAERILAALRTANGYVPSVGLVGASVSDHPQLLELVEELVQAGSIVSLSSVRADRASRRLLEWLARGRLRTLTLGLDGASSRIREAIGKGVTEEAFLGACENALAAGIPAVKVYCILGYPDENEDDVRELANLLGRIPSGLQRKLSLSVLVPKPGTPLANAPFPDVRGITRHVRLLRRLWPGQKFQSPSVKDARLEYDLDHGDGDVLLQWIDR